ncbi:MAG: glycosidase, partial [Planctomycetia bacterium]
MKSTNHKNGRGSLKIRRLPVTLTSDIRRVITRFFDPGGEVRIRSIVERIRGLSGGQVDRLLDEVFLKFRNRHDNIVAVLEENYRTGMTMIGMSADLSHNHRLLIGSYLTTEYSIESAALFNPSIVPHQNQRNLPDGAVRFIMSLRATGEGHVSSIVFRSGVITSDHQIQIDQCQRLARPGRVVLDQQYDKPLFRRKLTDIGVHDEIMNLVLNRLDESFTSLQLEHAITEAREATTDKLQLEASLQDIHWLAQSNYQLELPREAEASEVVIFPQTSNE